MPGGGHASLMPPLDPPMRYLGWCVIMVKTYIHPPMGGGVSTDVKIFKQNWNISIRSWFIQFLVILHDPTH